MTEEEPFIIKFLKTIFEISNGLIDVWARTSYKGFSPNKFYKSGYRRKYERGFNNLKQRGLLVSSKDGEFLFTQKGHRWLEKSIKRYLHKWGPWDKKWRVIIFDIPQEFHKERIRLRQRLKSFGCVMLQKSVFVFPYNCAPDLAKICADLNVSDYVDIILAESIGARDQELRKLFEL